MNLPCIRQTAAFAIGPLPQCDHFLSQFVVNYQIISIVIEARHVVSLGQVGPMPQPLESAEYPLANQSVRRRRILVIDDGDSVRDIIRIFLERDGFEVCGEAADGVEAIEQAKKLKPDLIVLDLAMPRMNGAEAASILSSTMPSVPIVLLTLYMNVLGPSLASAIGVKAVIDKTDGMDKLVACVRSLLNSNPATPESSMA
jgi:CheY-like chemotaxis protein